MKKLLLVISVVVLLASIVTPRVLLYQKSQDYDSMTVASQSLYASFYNAKDASHCLINVLLEQEEIETCDRYIETLIDDYELYNEYLDDISDYNY